MLDLRSRSRALTLAALAMLSCAAVFGCGGGTGSTTPGATGGQSGPDAGSGGQTGTGGQTATGGRTGTGGLTGSGGAAGGAGQQGTGGSAGTGGRGGSAGGGRGGLAGGGTAGSQDGGTSDATSDGSDGGTAFAPCPALGSACVIMPLGDSITDGFTPLPGGYRIELFHQMLLNRQTITFVGSGMNGPATVDGQTFPRQHEGHNGFTIDNAPAVGRSGILPLVVAGAITNTRPHIILLMIGTNDIDLNLDVANAPMRLATLIDRIIADAPNALLVVATIVPTRTDAENLRFQAYNGAIPALVQQRAAAGRHILLVDNYAAISADPNYKTALLADNLHPTPAGYAVLGQTWYAAIRSFVPAAP
jgi:lysophospholipase L1-like esterase